MHDHRSRTHEEHHDGVGLIPPSVPEAAHDHAVSAVAHDGGCAAWIVSLRDGIGRNRETVADSIKRGGYRDG